MFDINELSREELEELFDQHDCDNESCNVCVEYYEHVLGLDVDYLAAQVGKVVM